MRSKVQGLDRLSKRLKAIPKKIVKDVQPALMKSAQEMANDMRRLVPVDEGKLRDSITVTGPGETPPSYSQGAGNKPIPENAVAVTAGNSGARHAHFVEFGTSKAQAQPFFLPAYRSNRTRAANRVKRAISKAVREAK